ncbi:MAG: NHL repeat-containing protein [Acidobacteriota bacterium]
MDANRPDSDAARAKAHTRFWRLWFAPIAAVGALATLAVGAFRVRPTPRSTPSQPVVQPPVAPTSTSPAGSGRILTMAEAQTAMPARRLPRQYVQTAQLGGVSSPDKFLKDLSGIAAGADDHVYAIGDGEVRVFDAALVRLRSWRAPEGAACLAVGPDGRVYVGSSGRVDVFDPAGVHVQTLTVGEKDKPAAVTAIKVFRGELLVADANVRLIRRLGADGAARGMVGHLGKTGRFMLPNGSLDLAIDAGGLVYATDTGRHQVTTWTLDGAPIGKFGKFGMRNPEDFVGCCNPVNLALTPDGKVVTGEKMVARVKVFEPDGTLLAVIGPEHFDPACVHIHLDVDSHGRILAADPVRRVVTVFSLAPSRPPGEPA